MGGNFSGKWEIVEVADGTAQGDTSSTPCYSRMLRGVLRRAVQRLAQDGISIHCPSLVDDVLLITQHNTLMLP